MAAVDRGRGQGAQLLKGCSVVAHGCEERRKGRGRGKERKKGKEGKKKTEERDELVPSDRLMQVEEGRAHTRGQEGEGAGEAAGGQLRQRHEGEEDNGKSYFGSGLKIDEGFAPFSVSCLDKPSKAERPLRRSCSRDAGSRESEAKSQQIRLGTTPEI